MLLGHNTTTTTTTTTTKLNKTGGGCSTHSAIPSGSGWSSIFVEWQREGPTSHTTHYLSWMPSCLSRSGNDNHHIYMPHYTQPTDLYMSQTQTTQLSIEGVQVSLMGMVGSVGSNAHTYSVMCACIFCTHTLCVVLCNQVTLEGSTKQQPITA